MRSPILLAPTLIELALIAVLCSREARAPESHALTAAERKAEIHALQRQMKTSSTRLNELESQGHQFLPRGGGPAD